MDTCFTDFENDTRAMTRQFAKEVLAPKAAELDLNNEFPTEMIKELSKNGFMGIAYPEQYGGEGASSVVEAIVVEEISYACAATASILTAHYLGYDALYLAGNEEQKIKYLAPACQGELLAAFCLTEPDAGTDIGALRTNAKAEGDHYLLNGVKHFITNGNEADFLTVFAKTKNTDTESDGISVFVVERNTPGLTIGAGDDKMGIRGARTWEIIFEDCRIPKNNLIGEENKGLKIALEVIDRGRIGIAAMAVGLSQAALDMALTYSKERVAFGKSISKFQGLRWMMAEMATDLEAARLITYNAACVKDRGGYIGKEAAMAKLFASEASNRIVHKALQIHGGYGYMKEYPIERLYRDQRILELFEGTSQVQKMVISGALL